MNLGITFFDNRRFGPTATGHSGAESLARPPTPCPPRPKSGTSPTKFGQHLRFPDNVEPMTGRGRPPPGYIRQGPARTRWRRLGTGPHRTCDQLHIGGPADPARPEDCMSARIRRTLGARPEEKMILPSYGLEHRRPPKAQPAVFADRAALRAPSSTKSTRARRKTAPRKMGPSSEDTAWDLAKPFKPADRWHGYCSPQSTPTRRNDSRTFGRGDFVRGPGGLGDASTFRGDGGPSPQRPLGPPDAHPARSS